MKSLLAYQRTDASDNSMSGYKLKTEICFMMDQSLCGSASV